MKQLSALIVGLTISYIAIYLVIHYVGVNKSNVFNQDQTVCYSIGFDGWKRVTNRDRMAVSELVADNKAKMIEAQTLNCYDYSKKPFETIILREQWWKRLK